MSESEGEEISASSEEESFEEQKSSEESSVEKEKEESSEEGETDKHDEEYNELEEQIKSIDGYDNIKNKSGITSFTRKFIAQDYLNIPLLALGIFFHFSSETKINKLSVTSFINKHNKDKEHNPIDIIRYIRFVENNK